MFFKRLNDNFVVNIRSGSQLDESDISISETEYNNILSAIQVKPADTEDYVYLLDNDSLEWVRTVRPEPVPVSDLSPEEALNILLGGE